MKLGIQNRKENDRAEEPELKPWDLGLVMDESCVNAAGGSTGMSVSNLLKALTGSARSNKRRFFR